MEPATITVKVKEIVASITGVPMESIKDSATFVDDLGLDSLAILEIVVDVEKAFKIRANDDELQKVRSIDDSVALILRHTCEEVASSASF
ncbi:MAG TPA: acyl carrier protein [Chthoniobacterales bacterium]